MSNHTPKQATPKGLLLKELIGQNTPMSEREWAAAEEIIRLQDQNAALLAAQPLTDEQIDNAIRKPADDLLDYIYEHGTICEGVTARIRAIARAAIAEAKGETK